MVALALACIVLTSLLPRSMPSLGKNLKSQACSGQWPPKDRLRPGADPDKACPAMQHTKPMGALPPSVGHTQSSCNLTNQHRKSRRAQNRQTTNPKLTARASWRRSTQADRKRILRNRLDHGVCRAARTFPTCPIPAANTAQIGEPNSPDWPCGHPEQGQTVVMTHLDHPTCPCSQYRPPRLPRRSIWTRPD